MGYCRYFIFSGSIFSAVHSQSVQKKIGLKESERTILIFGFVVISFVITAFFVFDTANRASIAILVGGFIAACGWIYTNDASRENAKKAHTLTILLQMRNSGEFNKHKDIVLDHLDLSTPVNTKMILEAQERVKEKGINIVRSVRFVANYFEFLSAGYVTRDLDEALLIRSMRSIMIRFHVQFEPFLQEERKEVILVDGRPVEVVNEKIFENFDILVAEFRRKIRRENLSRKSMFEDRAWREIAWWV